MKNSYRGDRPDRGNGGKKFGGKRFGGPGGGGFGGGRDFDRRDGGRPEMFDATCAECGKDCQVPFRPSGGRPVYCSDCFGKRNEGGESRRPERSGGFGGGRGGFGGDRGPRKDKREHGGNGGQGVPLAEINYMKKQIATANAKLDALMQALIPSGSAALPEEKAAQEDMSFDEVMPEEEAAPKEKKAKKAKKVGKKKAKKK